MLSGPLLTESHQATNSRWGCIKNRYLIFLNDTPPSIRSGISWCALKHHARCPVHQWTIDNIAVSCDPTYISGTPIDIVAFDVKDKFGGGIHSYCVATMNMYDAFGFARTPA